MQGFARARTFGRSAAAFAAFSLLFATIAPAGAAWTGSRGRTPQVSASIKLANGERATVFSDGIERVVSDDGRRVAYRAVLSRQTTDGDTVLGNPLGDRFRLVSEAAKAGGEHAYAPNEVLVAFRDGIGAQSDVKTVPAATLRQLRSTRVAASIPAYTNDYTVNRALASLGADRAARVFRGNGANALAASRGQGVNPANAVRVHLSGASVAKAVATLAKLNSVAYVSPNWFVGSTSAAPQLLPQPMVAEAQQRAYSLRRASVVRTASIAAITPATSELPANYALASSGQSLLNAPSVNAAAAYDEVARTFHQLPGQGEIITNVSLGDIDDASAVNDANNSCHQWASAYGPTMNLIGTQHYMDFPSMPLIPAYVSDASGTLSGSAQVCGVDPQLVEIGLDFSMMAPLPHQLQRPAEQGSGMSDLLGIAPGAQYRLVVPSSPTIADVDNAFLAAALQAPRPTVITASLGFGFDSQGYASRYLEEDPLTEAVVASIVHNDNIVVCISAGDGLRTATTAPIGPSGGSVPLNTIAAGGTPTDLNDVAYSGAPSTVFDSGAIAVGGTTLDDLSAMPPQDPRYAQFANWHAFASTRWTGASYYSSGFGSRVNVSAPGDNVAMLLHAFGGSYDAVNVALNGGTSASAPQTAAAAAVAIQVAKLTGHPFHSALDVRALLERTANPLPALPQADVDVHVGPQIDLTRAVEALLSAGGKAPVRGVARVAVEQRRNAGWYDTIFTSDTDPANISLSGPRVIGWITIAPDWENIPAGSSYRLYVTGHKTQVLSTSRWARLLPQTILETAGQPFVSTSPRTVNLTYEATTGGTPVSTQFTLTFGPAAQPLRAHAPLIPPVINVNPNTTTLPIAYDLTSVAGVSSLVLTVSEPGRVNAATGNLFHPAYTVPLRALKGTVNVPLSALQGGGIYGAAISFLAGDGVTRSTDYAYTRIQYGANARPPAPLLANNGSTPGHFSEIPYGSSFQVQYDVRNVAGATGAMLEIAAPGPGTWRNQNAFNNPNGSERDGNGVDAGSVYYAPLSGTSGTITVNGRTAGLVPTLYHSVRVVPTKFGVPAGEASDVSTITMDGVVAADGGNIGQGWGVNANGLDGYLTSNQTTASGEALGSVEVFDQSSMGIASTIDSGLGNGYYTGGWGAWGGDVGLVGIQNASGQSNYSILNPISSGTLGATWTPPFPSSYLLREGALNGIDANGAFLVVDVSVAQNAPGRIRVFSSNLATNTFSSAYPIMGAIAPMAFPIIGGMAQDANLHAALVSVNDALADQCATPSLLKVDLTTGNTTAIPGVGAGSANGVEVDSQTHKAGVLTSCDGGLGIYDLQTGSSIAASLPAFGYSSLAPAADEKHALFLNMQFTAPDFASNNNSMSQLDVFDENGNLQKSAQAFNTSGFYWIGTHYLQLNPNRRVLFFPGPNQQQLEPFSY